MKLGNRNTLNMLESSKQQKASENLDKLSEEQFRITINWYNLMARRLLLIVNFLYC